jgi:DNA polymerase-4
VTFDPPTHLDSVIFENVLRLLGRARNPRLKVRLVGVRASNLERAVFQPNLLDGPKTEKLDRLFQAADKVRNRYGFDAVRLARSLEPGDELSKPKARRKFLGRQD